MAGECRSKVLIYSSSWGAYSSDTGIRAKETKMSMTGSLPSKSDFLIPERGKSSKQTATTQHESKTAEHRGHSDVWMHLTQPAEGYFHPWNLALSKPGSSASASPLSSLPTLQISDLDNACSFVHLLRSMNNYSQGF